MANFDQLKLESQLCHAVYSASNALARFYKPILEPLDLTYPQYLIMLSLWEEDGVNILAISKATYFDSGTLTPLLQKLKQKDFIAIEPDENDRRNKIVILTKKGVTLKRKAAEIPNTLSCILPFTGQDVETLKSLASALHQAIRVAESREGRE